MTALETCMCMTARRARQKESILLMGNVVTGMRAGAPIKALSFLCFSASAPARSSSITSPLLSWEVADHGPQSQIWIHCFPRRANGRSLRCDPHNNLFVSKAPNAYAEKDHREPKQDCSFGQNIP